MESKDGFNFTPKLDVLEAIALAEKFDLNDDRAAIAAGKKIGDGDFSPIHFEEIFEWKTRGRGRSRLKFNSDDEVSDALRLATIATTPRAAIAVLMGLHGVYVPVASAIMAVVKPNVHTVVDFRALQALDYHDKDRSLPLYLAYRVYCLDLAAKWQMSLRNLDRALWQWSKDRSATSE
jgi:hypothetical protein